MNATDADRQIQQMIAFIKQEAKEKAEEIEVKTQSACTAEKLNLTMQMSLSIREDYERMKKDATIQKRIARSKKVNSARMSSMEARNGKISELKDEIALKLNEVSKHAKYPELLKLLIIEACMTVHEQSAYVQCRKEDEAMVKQVLPDAMSGYSDIMSKAVGKKITIKLTLDTTDYLPPAPQKGQRGASCTGGIALHTNNKKIICRNTLDRRLDIAFEKLQPQIRGIMFGFREAPAAAAS